MEEQDLEYLSLDTGERIQRSKSSEGFKRNRNNKQRTARKKGKAGVILMVLAGFLGVCVLALVIICANAKRRLYSSVSINQPNLQMEDQTVELNTADYPVWEEGWIRYGDKIYEYDDSILTFLVMGVDEFGKVHESTDGVSGGQTDALILVVLHTQEKEIELIAINRDTMTDVLAYGCGNQYIEAQIATQHGFGDGMELSCELTRDTVSKLFYDLPIHGYISVNMGVVPQLNDAIGGVTVTIPEDVAGDFDGWEEGTEVTLYGIEAFYFVQQRDCETFNSNQTRLSRQKQYLTAFVHTAIEGTREDITLPVTIYQNLKDYIVTDISADEITYLAGKVISYSFSEDGIRTLEGTTQMGETFEEFYVDKDALRELIISVFYREVAMEN
ncbi:MAG: LCP family protein [Lachnospiraceae bacterium]